MNRQQRPMEHTAIDRRQSIRRLLEEIAEQAIPDDLHPWPAIHARLARAHAAERGQRSAQPRRVSPGGLAAASMTPRLIGLAIVVLLIGVLIGAPVTHAAVAAILQRFGLAFVDTMQIQSALTTTHVEPTAPPTPSLLSLAEAQQQVPFPIRTPAWLPEGVSLAGVRVDRTTVSTSAQIAELRIAALLTYRSVSAPDAASAQMNLEIVSGPNVAPFLLPRSRAQSVLVNGQEATYVRGGWRSDGQGDPEETLGDLRWDDSIDSAWLSWHEDGLTYTLSAFGLGLDKGQLLRVAESLR